MIRVEGFCVLSKSSGIMIGLPYDFNFQLSLHHFQLTLVSFRTREAVRNGTFEDFNINESYFLRCLYPDNTGDPDHVESGFLRSRWLLLVSLPCRVFHFYLLWVFQKTFHAIFISPSVDEDHFDGEPENGHPKRQKVSEQRYRPCSKSNISDLLQLNGRVTSRAIAYAAVLVSGIITQYPVYFTLFSAYL